jgi:hypothetical protein
MGFELVGNFHTTGGANYFRGKGGSADTPALAVPTRSRMRRVGIIDTHGGWHGFNCCPDFSQPQIKALDHCPFQERATAVARQAPRRR